MVKIKTTHVGSLPRSNELSDLLFKKDQKQKINLDVFDQIVNRDVNEVVKKQIDVGIDFISDGEMSKISYATYVKDRIDGFSGESERKAPKDLDDFPSFKERIARTGGTPTYTRPCCTNELKIKDKTSLSKDIKNFKEALNKNNHKNGFMNAASPGVISAFLPNKFYKNDDEYLENLSNVMKEEYEEITSNGIKLQLDCPDLALSRHMLFNDLSDEDFIKIANLHVEALNHALRDIPSEKIRVHICWGNYEGPHVCDISMKKMFDTLMSSKAQYLLFETSNPRHAHEWQTFQERKNDIPDNKILVPGCLDSTTNFVEHPMLVAERINKFVNIVGHDRVIGGTDCGFGTFAGFGAVDPDIAYAKLKSLAEGASLVK